MPFRRLALCGFLVTLLAACAAVPPSPAGAGQADFEGWPCDALADATQQVQQRAADLAYSPEGDRASRVLVLSPGAAVFWPALLAMRPDGLDAAELQRLKQRYEALDAVASRRGCTFTHFALRPPARAALPVALGERLVYEERSGARGPAQELGLRLLALKRGEFDFLLDDGPGTHALPWRQDAAGNALAPAQPHRLLSWTRLLRTQLALGDVLAGELQGPLPPDGRARVRGQVIAVGPAVLAGRAFDAATIELFGELPGGPANARIDGMLMVDRASGVLLRLELRSDEPAYALRRRLVRIEPAG